MDLMFCSEPNIPSCMQSVRTKYDFDSCQFEMERFVRDAQKYTKCLDDARVAFAKRANEAIQRYNCILPGPGC